jgi:hypothetical protein
MRPRKKNNVKCRICVAKTIKTTSSFSNLALVTSNFNLLLVTSQRLKFEINTKSVKENFIEILCQLTIKRLAGEDNKGIEKNYQS